MKYLYLTLIIALNSVASICQQATQPTIMVIPFTTENMSLRAAYENNEVARVAITKAKEAFDKRGVNTIDLIAKLKANNNNAVLKEGQAGDGKDEVIAISGADVYVVVEASKNYSSTGNSANVILTAYDAFSGESLANKTGNSPKIYSDNFEKLVEKAIEGEIDNLLNTIQEKFTLILKDGRSMVLSVGVADGSGLSLDDDVAGTDDILSDAVEDWVEKNAYKNYYHLQGATSNRMTFDIVKIPVYDSTGKSYRIREFTSDIRKYFKTIGLTAKHTVNGSNVVVTLSKE